MEDAGAVKAQTSHSGSEAGRTEPFAISAGLHDDTDYQERRRLKVRVVELESRRS